MESRSLERQVTVCLHDLSILSTVVSVKCTLNVKAKQERVEIYKFLNEARRKDLRFSVKLESLRDSTVFVFWDCRIRSINIQKDFHFVLHFIPVDVDKAQQLIVLRKEKLCKITFIKTVENKKDRKEKTTTSKSIISDNIDNQISALLEKVSSRTGQSASDILRSLTQFKNSQGKIIPGKDSIDKVSSKQKQVVLDKLRKMLHARG